MYRYKAGIVCCSNGQKTSNAEKVEYLESTLLNIGVKPVFSDFIYEKNGASAGNAKERAEALMNFYKDDEIIEIFDISGGDLANGVLPYLDYDLIKNSAKRFWGYSDLTTVINAIYAKTGKSSVLYQVRNLIYDFRKQQILDFCNTAMEGGKDLFNLRYRFVQGTSMQGVVLGGNIRCFLKLAGTEYMPDLKDKILLLESMGGDIPKIETYLCQLYQLHAFDKVSGILLGTFTQVEEEKRFTDVEMILKSFVKRDLPIAVTKDIGHGTDSKGIEIGKEVQFCKE